MDPASFDHLPCGVILLDAECRIRYRSPRSVALFSALAIGRPLGGAVAESLGVIAGDQIDRAARAVLANEQDQGGTWCLPGEVPRWIAWNLARGQPGLSDLALTLHDVTVQVTLRRDTEQAFDRRGSDALAESERRFQALADALPALVWMVDAEGRCDYVNRAWRDYTGRTAAEERASSWDHGLHPEDAAQAGAAFHAAVAARGPLRVEYRLRRHDGTWRWMLDAGAPRFTPDGAFAGFIGACIDIHERREASERARQAEERLRFALSAADLGVLHIDPVAGIDSRDGTLNRMLGLPAVDSSQPLAELFGRIHPDDRPAAMAGIAQGWSVGHYVGEVRILRPDGEVRWLRGYGRLAPGLDPRPAMIGVVLDITEQRRAEAELAETTAELRRSNAELEQFAYVASHDLQEPLRMIGSYLTLLRRRCEPQLDAVARDYVGHAVDGAVRMRQLIDDLLAFSRVGRPDSREEDVDLDRQLDEVLVLLASEVRRTGATIHRQPLPRVRAHRAQLTQLLQNLISNALKYRSDQPPVISIAAQAGDSTWTFSLRDNGIGIDPAHAERVFELFTRLHTRSEYPGTGIGLSICRKIVTLLGGRIWVESEPGTGSTFSFTIPATRIRAAPARIPAPVPSV